jgi:hypothetical protein
VTLSRVFNDQATKMGRLAARLLNNGFPLDATMDVLSYGPLSSHRYASVGDYRVALCQPKDSIPAMAEIKNIENEEINISTRDYFTDRMSLGKITMPFVSNHEEWHLAGGRANDFTISKSELSRYLTRGSMPVLLDGDILWDTNWILECL